MKSIKAQPAAAWLVPDNDLHRVVARRGERSYTRAMLRSHVAALCLQLIDKPEHRWALCFDDSYYFTVGLLAVLHAGKVPVVPGHCRQSVLQEQANEFDGVLTDIALTLDCPCVFLGAEQCHSSCDSLPAIPEDAYVVLFTSGSTGTPRQVIKPVRCLDEEARWLTELWGERLQGCEVIASVTHQHLYGLTFRIWLPLALGLSFDCRQLLYTEQLTAQDRQRRYAFISSPAFLRRVDNTLTPPACSLIVSAGGVLPWANALDAMAWFTHPVHEIYGSTETGVMAWRLRATDTTPWQLFSGVRLHCDEQQKWWAQSALIPQSQGHPLDDCLSFDAAGHFQLAGRHDRVVKIEDKRISLSEIERRLLALPDIVDAVALQVTRPERSGIGVVLVLNTAAMGAELAQLKRQWRHELHKWLEPLAMPRYWRIVDVIPHNSQSKRAWPQIQELFHAAH